MTITDPAVSAHADATIGLFEITDHITIDSTQGAHTVEMWCPVIGDGAFQRVLDVEVTSEDPYDLTREPEFGNLMLYSRLRLATAASWSIRYVVERRAIGHAPDPARARPLATAQLFSRALIPEAHVDVDERTRTLAQDVVGPETNPLEQARRIYDYVTGAMDYDATKQSFLGSTEHALTCSVGNCNDIHALFVSLCRSVDIPARFVLGQALELPQPGAQDCEGCGYHCWAEFFVAGLGWLPADASCATKYGTHGLFANLQANHIAWSIGRDILLAPPQRAGRSLFFAGPYAEIDGETHPAQRQIRFTAMT
ncbi:transglutaminase-like domain-containing protein [Mycobacterium tuberculosis]|uniref:transglutaminase-like domain-containing protein n=1 Tax=Mycobacterium tuberculosis TaxID=1773 RepID=UPI0005E70793|nr:transglutaminase family protein [Mycobacterium tuberculosis]CKO71052.1 transglutaminase domain-containing protein [Mycobacterium tuberculosis]